MNRNAVIAALLLGLGASGCLFEPECDSYDTCTTPPQSGQPVQTTPEETEPDSGDVDSGPIDVVGCDVPAPQCPDSDNYSIGGTERYPLGCGSTGRLETFSFEEEAVVCAGKPRTYTAWVESCSRNTYILKTLVTPLNGCLEQAAVSFEFADFECGNPDTRCVVEGGIIENSFIVDDDIPLREELSLTVDARAGGFEYRVEIYSRP